MTTKFLEHPDIKGKDVLGKIFIQNLSVSKGVGLKAYELSVIQDVLNKQFSNTDKINMEEFRKAVLSQMMPLDIVQSTNRSDYAYYGLDEIGLESTFGVTYVLNSPFNHGKTGHFSHGDVYGKEIDIDNIEIKEIPVGRGNPSPKFAVIQKGVELTRENIQQNVYTIEKSREDAQEWIDKQSQKVPTYDEDGETSGDKAKSIRPLKNREGLFSSFRAYNPHFGETSNIVEIQSDSFQNGVGISEQKNDLLKDLDRYEKSS